MRLLFFGTYDATRHQRVAILADGFRARGDTVEECNVPLGFDTAARVRMLQRPWLLVALAFRVVRTWVTLWRRARRLEGPYDAVVVGYLGHLDVHLARRLFRGTPIVLDYFVSLADTSADRGAGVRPLRRVLRRVDAAATRAADVVLVDTEAQRATVWAPPRDAVLVVPVGAPRSSFRAPVALPETPLRVVFFGLFTPLQGAPVIGRAVAALAGEAVTFTMVGTGQDLAATQAAARANDAVEWRSWVSPDALPDVVASHHVCLGIVGTGPKALRVVPNKVYQGAAAGCVVVTSDTPPQRAALGDAACYVPAGDEEALAAALRSLAADPARVAALRQAAYDAAQRYLPEHVVTPLREHLR
jgi:glycosyltransferase involved in cell wall biosynthesis